MRALPQRIATAWSELSLAGQFAIAALTVLGCGMALFGTWMTDRIERGVVQNTAKGAAVYINTFVEPYVQELATGNVISERSQRSLDMLLKETPLRTKVIGIKVWLADGTVAYSNFAGLAGRTFTPSARLKSAFAGEVAANFEEGHDHYSELKDRDKQPLLEIYSPIRAKGSDRIIAVAEFYEDGSQLTADLRAARLQTWVIVALLTLAMLGLLFGIVRRGSRTIVVQQQNLEERIAELSLLLTQNEDFRRRIDELHRRSVETNELLLRRVGTELHDGPAQLISFALLRLDSLRPKHNRDAELPMDDFERIRNALTESLSEIRDISSGLALPELQRVSLPDALKLAARNHERRTGTTVKLDVDSVPADEFSTPLKSCLYRFAQEGLNNAFRHAGGAGQSIRARFQDDELAVEVIDAGPGFEPEEKMLNGIHLGLTGMRDRIASLGGTLEIFSQAGTGTRLTARFKVVKEKRARM